MDVRGHAAVVTGGGSGLGAETARHLARAGHRSAGTNQRRDRDTGGLCATRFTTANSSAPRDRLHHCGIGWRNQPRPQRSDRSGGERDE